jgi:hypothetical protein
VLEADPFKADDSAITVDISPRGLAKFAVSRGNGMKEAARFESGAISTDIVHMRNNGATLEEQLHFECEKD